MVDRQIRPSPIRNRVHGRASLINCTEQLATPKTGEKRKRGRPRKNPEAPTPKPADGPKRGRGRPRKVVSEADLAAAAAASEGPKRGRGRPRKEPGMTPQRDGWFRMLTAGPCF